MNSLFQSATLKLTAWYLFILVGVGIMFSVIIYQVASSEVSTRLDSLEQRLERELGSSAVPSLAVLRSLQTKQAEANLFMYLIYMNAAFLAVGGVASYIMARRTLQPIERAHEAQSRFTSDASHELRTPLAAMKTELEVALRDPKLSKQEMRELLSSNLEEVDKLAKISQTLLLLSRLEHSAIATGRVAVDDIVRRIVDNANQKQSRIIYTPPDKPLYITAHQVSIDELVTILIDNALKYSPPTSHITVTLKKRGRKARLQVVNSGKGIHADELPYIFERFYRADESRTGGEKTGFGLGLSIAKKIVELHKGDLSVSSHPGKTTTFTVSLPLYESASKRKQKTQQSASSF